MIRFKSATQLLCGDCVSLMKNIVSDCIDLTVTSPPYDNLRTYNGYTFDFIGCAKELYRVTKSGGVLVWVSNDATIKGSESGTSFKQALTFKTLGFNLHDTMIWQKPNYVPLTHRRYEQAFEYMFVLVKGKLHTFNGITIPSAKILGGSKRFESNGSQRDRHSPCGVKETKLKSNVWEYSIGHNQCGHPATFPIRLALDHITSWSQSNDLILDPMCGSGTVGIAAKMLDRRFIGIDCNSDYIDLARQRIAVTSK